MSYIEEINNLLNSVEELSDLEENETIIKEKYTIQQLNDLLNTENSSDCSVNNFNQTENKDSDSESSLNISIGKKLFPAKKRALSSSESDESNDKSRSSYYLDNNYNFSGKNRATRRRNSSDSVHKFIISSDENTSSNFTTSDSILSSSDDDTSDISLRKSKRFKNNLNLKYNGETVQIRECNVFIKDTIKDKINDIVKGLTFKINSNDLLLKPSNSNLRPKFGITRFRCGICKNIFLSKKSLKSHLLLHKKFACSLCPEKFTRKLNLLAHRKRVHKRKPKNLYKCLKCNKTYKLERFLKRHQLRNKNCSMNKEKFYCCDLCCKTYQSYNGLKHHNKTYHAYTDFKFKCNICHLSIVSKYWLNLHMKQHLSTGSKGYL